MNDKITISAELEQENERLSLALLSEPDKYELFELKQDVEMLSKQDAHTTHLENLKLKQEIAELEKLIDIRNNREYRKKYIAEYQKDNPNTIPDFDEIYKEYFELKQRLENAVELKFKVGDTVYRITNGIEKYYKDLIENTKSEKKVIEVKILNILNGKDGIVRYRTSSNLSSSQRYSFKAKELFKTKEEAQHKLKELEE